MITVYRIGFCKYIDDLTGTGAALNGGRWNSEGTYMLYTASSASLSILEVWVHLNMMQLQNDFCRLHIQIPTQQIHEIEEHLLPPQWKEFPAPKALQRIGDEFISDNRYLALKVPSAVEPEEWNYLINPAHPGFVKVQVHERKTIRFDNRMLKTIKKITSQ
jgi:RES domain-containing protein